MSLPRPVLPGRFYMVTRRCTQRQFLLRPDAATNNAFSYCLIEAAKRTEVEVLLPCAMSNHYHAVIFDRVGRYPEFIEHFHKMLAKTQNALRARCENFWASGQTSVVWLADREAVLDKLAYTATNPVLKHLVDRVHHWPGVNGYTALLAGRPLHGIRPSRFFRAAGKMPKTISMKLQIPPELGDELEVLGDLRARVQAIETERATERHRTGRRVSGRRSILAQSWRHSPDSTEPQHGLRPSVAGGDKWARLEALQRNRDFVTEYARVRKHWLCGMQVAFPAGTYWLVRFARAAVKTPHCLQCQQSHGEPYLPANNEPILRAQ